MLEAVFRSIVGLVFAAVSWLVLIPVGAVFATPVVFVLALCSRKGTLRANVKDEYRQLWNFGRNWAF
jgi:hypothetical protein